MPEIVTSQRERCSCGAEYEASGDQYSADVRNTQIDDWRRRHADVCALIEPRSDVARRLP